MSNLGTVVSRASSGGSVLPGAEAVGFAESFPQSGELIADGALWPLAGKELKKRANTSAPSFIR